MNTAIKSDIIYRNDEAFAIEMDSQDQLANYRNLFHFPKDANGKPVLYFCGNSLDYNLKCKDIYRTGIKGLGRTWC